MSKHIYYLPTYLQGKPPETDCTLLVRIYDKHKVKSGRYITTIKMDALHFDDEQAMAAAIRKQAMRDLPAEAESDQMYVPPRLRSASIRRIYS